MTTKTFSARADEGALAFADALARKQYGLSFGQYCGTVLIEDIQWSGRMPTLSASRASKEKQRAAAFIKDFPSRVRNPVVGRMSDAEIRDLIASRYE